jgi:carbon-monoxide dehydrogenase medium subunit
MKPAGFEYHAPASLDEALALLERYGPDAKPLAGGQSLVPAMNFRLAQPAILIDLNRIESLAGIDLTPDGGLRIGAMTRQRAVERSPEVAARVPLLAETMPWVAHAPIRNRGTIGGNLAHADPASELPAVMVALGARLRLQSAHGERWIDAADFFLGLFTTALEAGELVTAIDLPPAAPRSGSAFLEVARRHGDYALAGVACSVTLDPERSCDTARAVLLGVSEGPVSVDTSAIVGTGAGTETETGTGTEAILDIAERVGRDLDPPGDIHASPAYRRHLASVLIRRGLTLALARAAEGHDD